MILYFKYFTPLLHLACLEKNHFTSSNFLPQSSKENHCEMLLAKTVYQSIFSCIYELSECSSTIYASIHPSIFQPHILVMGSPETLRESREHESWEHTQWDNNLTAFCMNCYSLILRVPRVQKVTLENLGCWVKKERKARWACQDRR